ncbi:MAG: tetratricopeptide repeat protein [Nitrospirales bacterium]
MKFHFILPLWGQAHTDLFLSVCLPSQLTHGNLGSFLGSGDLYRIFTTTEDAVVIQSSPIFQKLSEFIQPEIYIIDDIIKDLQAGKINKYDVMTCCHSIGVEGAAADEIALIFLWADVMFSENSLRNLRDIALSGKRLVLIGGYRLDAETFREELLQKYYCDKDLNISISSRELVGLSLQHVHSQSTILFWNSQHFHSCPAYLYWNAPNGILERGFHLAPLLINPSRREQKLIPDSGIGIDGYDYMFRAVPDPADIYIVNDSDIICPANPSLDGPAGNHHRRASIFAVADWAKKNCYPYHLECFRSPIRFHSTELNDDWERAEEEAEEIATTILKLVDLHQTSFIFQKELNEQKVRDEAVQNAIVQLRVEDALMHTALGLEYCKSDRLKEAEEVWLKAIALDPRQKSAHALLGQYYMNRGELESAFTHLKTVVYLKPDDINGWKTLVELYDKLGLDELVTDCSNVIRQLQTRTGLAIS